VSSLTNQPVADAQKRAGEAAEKRNKTRFEKAYGNEGGKKRAEELMLLLRRNLTDK
jgi:hypothetical protein